MALIRAWSTPKAGGEQCLCPGCGWSGSLSKCDPQLDEVALCPKCGHWVEYRDPPEDNTMRKSK